MLTPRIRHLIALLVPVLTAGILLLDWMTPLGVADWVLYFIPLLLSFYAHTRTHPYVLAAIFSVLTVLGFLLSPAGMAPGMAAINLILGLGILWVVTLLVMRLRQSLTENVKMSVIVEQCPASIVITNPGGCIEYVNPKFCAVTGFSLAEVRGRDFCAFKSGAKHDEACRELWAAISNGREWHGEFETRKKSGELFWESTFVSPVRDDLGKITNLIAIMEDVSSRKQAAQEAAEACQFLDRVINTAGEPIFVKDRQHRWVVMNDANCAMLGRDRREMLGKTVRDVFPKSVADLSWARDEEVFNSGKETVYEEMIPDGTGKTRMVITRKTAYRNEKGEEFLVGVLHDITERKQMETELRESACRQKAILDNSPDPLWLKDAQGRHLAVNKPLAWAYGLAPEAIIGKTVLELFPGLASKIHLVDQAVIRTGKPFRGELCGLSAEAQSHWFEVIKSPIFDGQGVVTGMVCVGRDITERRQADAAQREQLALRESLAKLAANVPGIIYSFRMRPDGSTCIPYISPTVEDFYGVRADEVVEDASPALNLIHAGDRLQVNESIAASARTMQRWRAEFRVNHPRKGLFWIEGQSTPEVEPDGSILWHGFMSDIGERKIAENALRESEEKFRQLADNITDVFWVASPSLDAMHYVSPGYDLIWGLPRESLYASPHQWVESILPEEREQVFAIFAGLGSSRTEVSAEYRLTRPDGSIRWIYHRGFQVRDAAGTVVRLAGIASDITERKQAAQALAEHKEKEAHARRELEREHALNETKGRFVSLVSHEFRTPLCAINMAAFMLSDYGESMDLDERTGHAREIQKAVGRMTAIMEDFLLHDQIQTGKMVFEPAMMDLQLFCQELIPEVVNRLDAGRVVKCFLEPAIREAFLDRKILRYILGNLLSNAVKYSAHDQPVVIKVRRAEAGLAEPRHSRTPDGDWLEFQVIDSGIGIPADDLGRLFKTFHRAANVGTRHGTGMGLAIVKQLVELHGGGIRVESTEGRGTTFWLWLPCSQPAGVAVPKAAATSLAGLRTPNPAALENDIICKKY